MNGNAVAIFYERAKLVENLDKIISSARSSKSSPGQLSLFGEIKEPIEVSLSEPKNFNPIAMMNKELDAIGINITASPYDEFEIVRCRYCDSTISATRRDDTEVGQKTFLASIREIEYRTSKLGNPYAKITFSDNTGEERMYLSGNLYKKKLVECRVGTIYLVTVRLKEDGNMELINFMPARDAEKKVEIKMVYIKTPLEMIPTLRLYLKVFMKGDDHSTCVYLHDSTVIKNTCNIKVDNANLVEMRKHGFEVTLR